MTRAAVITAIFGGYDTPKPHPDIPGVDFVCYTDRPADAPGWDIRVVETPGHPRRAAKHFKLHAGSLLPDHDFTIWVDGSHEILTANFVTEAIAAIDDTGIALYKHPWRDCIYDEATASLTENPAKYGDLPLLNQVAAYRDDGHPAHWGLWATGTIARRNTADMHHLMVRWDEEISRWTIQDQLSLPVVLRRAGIRPAEFPHHQVFNNPWTAIHGHHRDD